MEFHRYQHIERYGNEEVEGIDIGTCYIFPKLDGTNASVWLDPYDGKNNICAGSRNRELSVDADNQGFMAKIIEDERIQDYLYDHPLHRLYGEFLVKHSLKTYRDEAWKRFWIFDILDYSNEEQTRYVPYEEYQPVLESYGLDYILCFAKIDNPKEEDLQRVLQNNTFLIKDNEGIGEGIVIKNYDYLNKFGRPNWAKIVTTEFKEKHIREMRTPNPKSKNSVEERIVEEYCTSSLIEKTHAKIVNECDGWSSKYIPRLLNTVYHDLVVEEMWNITKKLKNPTVNFKTLQKLVDYKVKEVKKELF